MWLSDEPGEVAPGGANDAHDLSSRRRLLQPLVDAVCHGAHDGAGQVTDRPDGAVQGARPLVGAAGHGDDLPFVRCCSVSSTIAPIDKKVNTCDN